MSGIDYLAKQQNRAVRLQALLSAAFAEHGRITLMVQGFQEGLDISPEFDSRASEPYGNRNGFELLRQLTKEFKPQEPCGGTFSQNSVVG